MPPLWLLPQTKKAAPEGAALQMPLARQPYFCRTGLIVPFTGTVTTGLILSFV